MKLGATIILAYMFISPHVDAAAAPPEAPPEEMLRLRDPFKRPNIVSIDSTPRTELEGFSVDQFKMVGVITGPEHLRAMLIAPNGKTYFVAEHTKIGPRKGIIKKITADSIVIRERIVNVLGQEENVDSEIHLPVEARHDIEKSSAK